MNEEMLRRRELCQMVFVALDIQLPTDSFFLVRFRGPNTTAPHILLLSVDLFLRKGCPWSVNKHQKKSGDSGIISLVIIGSGSDCYCYFITVFIFACDDDQNADDDVDDVDDHHQVQPSGGPLNSHFGRHRTSSKCIYIYMCQGLNSHSFHAIGDGHQPNSRGLYTHYKDSY